MTTMLLVVTESDGTISAVMKSNHEHGGVNGNVGFKPLPRNGQKVHRVALPGHLEGKRAIEIIKHLLPSENGAAPRFREHSPEAAHRSSSV